MSDRKLPKSLHTVTVLVNLSRFLMVREPSAKVAIKEALQILELSDLPDVYKLADAALAQLSKPSKAWIPEKSIYDLNEKSIYS